jgi:hypothetical protein
MHVERIREVRGDEISETTQSHVIKGTATIVRVLQEYNSTGCNANPLGESKDKAGGRAVQRYYEYCNTVRQEATRTQLGEGKDKARRAVDRYIPVKVVTSELKEIERAIWRCTGLKL